MSYFINHFTYRYSTIYSIDMKALPEWRATLIAIFLSEACSRRVCAYSNIWWGAASSLYSPDITTGCPLLSTTWVVWSIYSLILWHDVHWGGVKTKVLPTVLLNGSGPRVDPCGWIGGQYFCMLVNISKHFHETWSNWS